MTATAAPKVFVSYRRQGTAMHAGRLYDAMVARFGDRDVFMDLEMAPGVDFVERITTAVGGCRTLLVVMGPDWATACDRGATGRPRLADPNDFVRIEVETALQAEEVTVIPVLVAGARMPDPEQLPDALRPLTRRNAIELSDLRWRFDCERLMSALDVLLSGRSASNKQAKAARPASPSPVRALVPLWLEGVAVAAVAGMLARNFPLRAGPEATDVTRILVTMARRAETWAVIGAVLAVWMGLRRGDQGRMLRRIVTGLSLGAVAGAIGGAIYALAAFVPADPLDGASLMRVSIVALATTGCVLGAAIGALWVPRRPAAGSIGGALGGVIGQILTNTLSSLSGDWALGIHCVFIVGFGLFAMLALDVRAAAGARQPGLAPEAARA